MTTKSVGILWKTCGENNRIYICFCDFRVPVGVHFGDPGQHKNKNQGVVVDYFSGVGSGWVLGWFLDVFLLFLVPFW